MFCARLCLWQHRNPRRSSSPLCQLPPSTCGFSGLPPGAGAQISRWPAGLLCSHCMGERLLLLIEPAWGSMLQAQERTFHENIGRRGTTHHRAVQALAACMLKPPSFDDASSSAGSRACGGAGCKAGDAVRGGGQRWGQSQRGNSPHGPGQGHAASCIPTDGLSGEILSIPEAFLCGAHPQEGPSRRKGRMPGRSVTSNARCTRAVDI